MDLLQDLETHKASSTPSCCATKLYLPMRLVVPSMGSEFQVMGSMLMTEIERRPEDLRMKKLGSNK